MWDELHARTVIDARPHRCNECDDTIHPNVPHLFASGLNEGRPDSYRLHAECDLIAREGAHAFWPHGFPLGECREILAREHGIADPFLWALQHRKQRLETDAGLAERLTQDRATNAVLTRLMSERRRHVFDLGWTPDHDDGHPLNALIDSASAYALSAAGAAAPAALAWPWESDAFKPRTPREDLERAGALIVAALEHMDRAEARAQPTSLEAAE